VFRRLPDDLLEKSDFVRARLLKSVRAQHSPENGKRPPIADRALDIEMEMSPRVRMLTGHDQNLVRVRANAPPALKVQARVHSVTPEGITRIVPVREEKTDTSSGGDEQRAHPVVERV
jgi:hypothetical protein